VEIVAGFYWATISTAITFMLKAVLVLLIVVIVFRGENLTS
jgi:uncharacterized membrane protein